MTESRAKRYFWGSLFALAAAGLSVAVWRMGGTLSWLGVGSTTLFTVSGILGLRKYFRWRKDGCDGKEEGK